MTDDEDAQNVNEIPLDDAERTNVMEWVKNWIETEANFLSDSRIANGQAGEYYTSLSGAGKYKLMNKEKGRTTNYLSCCVQGEKLKSIEGCVTSENIGLPVITGYDDN